MFRAVALSAIAVVLLSSCAKRPDAISPMSIPMQAYAGRDCVWLQRQLDMDRTTLAMLSDQQHNAATGDAIGVFLFAVPLGSALNGDKEGKVAVAKGKIYAVEAAMGSKRCFGSPQ